MDVLVAGLDEEACKRAERIMQRSAQQLSSDDDDRVSVLPSSAWRDRWIIGVRRRDGWSIRSFESNTADLSRHATDALRELLRGERRL